MTLEEADEIKKDHNFYKNLKKFYFTKENNEEELSENSNIALLKKNTVSNDIKQVYPTENEVIEEKKIDEVG